MTVEVYNSLCNGAVNGIWRAKPYLGNLDQPTQSHRARFSNFGEELATGTFGPVV